MRPPTHSTAPIAWLVLILVCAHAAPAHAQRTGETLPPQGLYEGCPPSTAEACAARLGTIRAGGFRTVLNYSAWYGSPDRIRAYADAAAALGLQLIWPLNHPAWRGLSSLGAAYPALSAGLGDHATEPQLRERAIALVAGHPATWGFYIGDELPPSQAPHVARLSATLRGIAPGKPQLYIARPGAARLRPFAALADLAGVDVYPVGSGDPPVGRAARTAGAVAGAVGSRTAIVLQAFSWSQYRPAVSRPLYPTARRLRGMRDAALRHSDPAMILWYSFQDIVRSDRPCRRWGALTWAAFAPLRRPPRLRSCM